METFLSQYRKADKRLNYGTAGFRDNVDLPMEYVFARMGIFASLRSRCCDSKCIGVMITASHNPECDNGIKIVDVDGGMLTQSWEPLAEKLANELCIEDFLWSLKQLEDEHCLVGDNEGKNINEIPAVVIIGRDTRSHSARLSECVIGGVHAYGGHVIDLGVVTTPQLHFIVQSTNSANNRNNDEKVVVDSGSFDVQSALDCYYETLSDGYIQLLSTLKQEVIRDNVIIDASFGVGTEAVTHLVSVVNRKWKEYRGEEGEVSQLSIDVRNCAGAGPVNEGCGAEYVQKGQVPPRGVDAVRDKGKMLCSFDGDADRVVFHRFSSISDCGDSIWSLIDGDKISCLLSIVLYNELKAANLLERFTYGVVQTAYANGASTNYLREQGVPIVVAKTGVKFLHHKALLFDVGLYFEANGHGTVLFSEKMLAHLTATDANEESDHDKAQGLRRLQAFTKIINQAVGDALSDMLAALACLHVLHMDLEDWVGMYTDLPSKQLKVFVQNKSLITCSDDETTALTPLSLPVALRASVEKIPQGRCFVRPSGTEDVVRIYAEAKTQEGADLLALESVRAVKQSLGEA